MDEFTPKKKGNSIFKLSISLLLVVPAMLFWAVFLFVVLVSFGAFVSDDSQCTVARIPLQGVITTTESGLGRLLGMGTVTSADSIVQSIRQANEDENKVAILIDVDSPGGTPVAGDEIMTALQKTEKPTVAVVRDRGTSAAYWAMAGADYIVASPVSDVGSIGVTMSYREFASSTEISGSRWIDISSGEYKDAGNPSRVLSEDEQEYFQRQVDAVHAHMVDRVADAREMMSREDVAQLSDGRAYLGTEALTLGLIDEVGGFDTALDYLRVVLSGTNQSVELCAPKGGGLEDIF